MDAQADVCLCCSHMAKTGFLMTWLSYENLVSLFIRIYFVQSKGEMKSHSTKIKDSFTSEMYKIKK